MINLAGQASMTDGDQLQHEFQLSDIALWVKSGNRGNLKCLKVNDYFALIFHRNIFISFFKVIQK